MSKWTNVEDKLPLGVKDLKLADGTRLACKSIDIIVRMNDEKSNDTGVQTVKFCINDNGDYQFYLEEIDYYIDLETSLTKNDKTYDWITHWMYMPTYNLD